MKQKFSRLVLPVVASLWFVTLRPLVSFSKNGKFSILSMTKQQKNSCLWKTTPTSSSLFISLFKLLNTTKYKVLFKSELFGGNHEISGYEASDAYGWSNHIFGLGPADPSLTEENSHSLVDWNYEELDASINNYNVSENQGFNFYPNSENPRRKFKAGKPYNVGNNRYYTVIFVFQTRNTLVLTLGATKKKCTYILETENWAKSYFRKKKLFQKKKSSSHF